MTRAVSVSIIKLYNIHPTLQVVYFCHREAVFNCDITLPQVTQQGGHTTSLPWICVPRKGCHDGRFHIHIRLRSSELPPHSAVHEPQRHRKLGAYKLKLQSKCNSNQTLQPILIGMLCAREQPRANQAS